MEPFYVSPALYASKGKRLGNFLIDYACRILMALGAGFFLGVLSVLTDNDGLLRAVDNLGMLERVVAEVVLVLVYYTFLEGIAGISIGKLITGTKVVTHYGEKPGFGQALGRSFARLIPFEALSGLLGEQFWHDSLTETVVVDRKAFEREKWEYDHAVPSAPEAFSAVNNSDESP